MPPPPPGQDDDLAAAQFEGDNPDVLGEEHDAPDEPPSRVGGIQNPDNVDADHFRNRWEGVYRRTIIAAIAASALAGGVFAAGGAYASEYAWLSQAYNSSSWVAMGVTGWLSMNYFTHNGLRDVASAYFTKCQTLMNGGLVAFMGGREVENPILVVRSRCPRFEVMEHPMLFLGDICRPFQVIFPGSLLLTAASFRLVLSLPLGMLCCYWYAMRWQWHGSLPPNVGVVPGCPAPGDRRFGPDFAMNAPVAKHIIAWLWQFWSWATCRWPSLGLGMPVWFAVYDRRGDTAHLVAESVAKRPGSTLTAIPDFPATIKVYDHNTEGYRTDTSPAALNITALRINVPTAATVVAALRALV